MTLIYENLVRGETDEAVIAKLISKGWTEQPAPPSVQAGEQAVWVNGQWVVQQVPSATPEEVKTWALREAVQEAGKTSEIQAVLNALPGDAGIKARNRWEYKETIRRDTPLFLVVKQAVGWTDTFIDGLFVRAEQIASE